ncbi:MAG: C39 family peptidase [Thermomicrobiales bacterium]
MRRALTVIMAALILVLAGGPLGASTAIAQSQSVTGWVTVDATSPSAGCSVGVTVEVRSNGGSVGGADVVANLAMDDGSGEVISSDRGITDDAGVAYLVYETSAGWDGAKAWLEILVNGSYLGGTTVLINDANGCGSEGVLLELSGSVASVADTTMEVPTETADVSSEDVSNSESVGGSVIIPGVDAYQQQRGLSCEYAALSIATGALGGWVNEYSFDNVVGLSDNPHWGYRGDITGVWGNTVDYGVYNEPLAAALPAFGFNGYAFYGGGSTGELTAQLDAGRPTLVWLGMWGDVSTVETTSDGTSYQVTAGMHVMTAYGYDEGGVYLSDPGSGRYRYYDWGTFIWMWNVMDGMALAVSS